MKIVGQMALCKFPMWEQCLRSLAEKVGELYLRFDGLNGDKDILRKLDSVCGEKLKDVYIGSSKWNPWNWREEMIRMLDLVKPDIVISYDEDEEVGSIASDMREFIASEYKQMALDYKLPMPTIDGRNLHMKKAYPSKPHVVVIKWEPDLTFKPYLSKKRVTQYGKKYFLGKAKILHYCHYTPEMEKEKIEIILARAKKVWRRRNNAVLLKKIRRKSKKKRQKLINIEERYDVHIQEEVERRAK